MVKYTTPLPSVGLSESDSKLLTNFKFCEWKKLKHLKKHIDLQSRAIFFDKNNFKKNLHILVDGASRYVEHINCLKIIYNMIKQH